MNKSAYELAECVRDAAEIREGSYDKVAAELAAVSAANNGTHDNPERHYKLSLRDACVRACPDDLVEPTYLLLKYNWNEALDWANERK